MARPEETDLDHVIGIVIEDEEKDQGLEIENTEIGQEKGIEKG